MGPFVSCYIFNWRYRTNVTSTSIKPCENYYNITRVKRPGNARVICAAMALCNNVYSLYICAFLRVSVQTTTDTVTIRVKRVDFILFRFFSPRSSLTLPCLVLLNAKGLGFTRLCDCPADKNQQLKRLH